MTHISLDERWLSFLRRSGDLFERYPFMIPVRQELFKSLTAKTDPISLEERLKIVGRAVVKRQHSVIRDRVDVLLWLDSARNVFIEALVPLYHQMRAQGMNVGFAVRESIVSQIPSDLRQVVVYRTPFPLLPRRQWSRGWTDFVTLHSDALKPDARAHFYSIALSADANESEIARVLDQVRPKMLVLAADHYVPNSIACEVGRAQGVRSLVIQHGIVQAFYTPLIADEMVVWGETSLNTLSGFGVDNSRLLNLGSPRYDLVKYQHESTAGAQFRNLLHLSDNPVFVFFSNGNDYVRNGRDVLEACADWLERAACQLRDEVQIVVRLHPNEDGRLYADKPNLRVIKHECDAWLSMAGADVVGSLCSTALIEGLLYNKPVLQFYADGWQVLADNWQHGLAERIASANGLVQALRHPESSSAPLIQRIFNHQGTAAQRITEYVARSIA